MKKLAFALLGVIALSSSAMAGQSTKPPVLDVIDYDRFQYDGCYMSNCGNVPTAASAPAVVTRSPTSSFTILSPSYGAGQSCTSLLSQLDNQWLTILQTSSPFTIGPSGRMDITLNSEPRIRRRHGFPDPANMTPTDTGSAGIGAIGVRAFVLPTGTMPTALTIPDFERWVLNESVTNTLRTVGANPAGNHQPIISTSSIRRLLTLPTPAGYDVIVQAKWSTVFTSLQLELGGSNFIAGGGSGAVICVPQLTIETF